MEVEDGFYKLATFYKDTKMTLQERTAQALVGTIFEFQEYPNNPLDDDNFDKQKAIGANLEWMISTAKDPEAADSARRVLDDYSKINGALSW